MPVVIVNPSEYACRHVWLFNGPDQVKFIRDPKTGNLSLDRSPIAEFLVDPAIDSNYYGYFAIYLPPNSSFLLYEQARQPFWGFPMADLYQTTILVGSNPYAVACDPRTPRWSIRCAACIQLPYVGRSGPQQLRPEMELNPGLYIKSGIESIINFLFRKPQEAGK